MDLKTSRIVLAFVVAGIAIGNLWFISYGPFLVDALTQLVLSAIVIVAWFALTFDFYGEVRMHQIDPKEIGP